MRFRPVLFCKIALAAVVLSGTAHAQTMDYNLSQAMRSISSLTSAVDRLQPTDKNGLNRLSRKLEKSLQLLETSESTAHPDYQSTAGQLAVLKQRLEQFGGDQLKSQTGSDRPSATEPVQKADQAQSQTMDYNLNRSIRDLESIAYGLSQLRENDVNGFNRLSTKLNNVAELLQGSESKSHPDFTEAVQQWAALQQRMAPMALALQQAQEQQRELMAQQQVKEAEEADARKQASLAQEQKQAEQRAKLAAEIKQQSKAGAAGQTGLKEQSAQAAADITQRTTARLAEQAKLIEQRAIHEQTALTVLNPIKAKYQRGSLPTLSDTPTPAQAREWAVSMQALRTTELQADVAKIDAIVAAGTASAEDARTAKMWITDGSQLEIESRIREARMKAEGWIISAGTFADMVNAVASDDKNGAYRFAKTDNGVYERNLNNLERALQAGDVVLVYNDIFGESENNQTEMLQVIASARNRLIDMKPIADQQAVVVAAAKPAHAQKSKDFLKPVAQEFWYEGNLIAERESDGSIWIDANDVADITNNGEIWIEANEMGSIEPNGEVWFNANHVGNLVNGGEVWRGGNQVGLIDNEGTAWVNGNPTGKIEPFNGEWRRAAIIYYFSDFFRQGN